MKVFHRIIKLTPAKQHQMHHITMTSTASLRASAYHQANVFSSTRRWSLIFAAAAAFGLAVCPQTFAVTLIDDTFTTNEVSTYTPKAAGEPTLGWNSVSSLMTVSTTEGGQYFTKTFETGPSSVSLLNTGDSLQLSFDWTGSTVTGALRFGFFNSSGDGYAVSIGTPSDSSTGSSGFRTLNFGATNQSLIGSSSAGLNRNVSQSLTLSIERESNGDLSLFGSWSAANSGSITSVGTTISALSAQYSFDRISIVTGSGGPNTQSYTVDNVLAVTSVPEPSTWALLIGFGIVMILVRRRRAK